MVVGLTETSPLPVVLVVRPFCLSQYRSATSWVLPSDGLARDCPLSCEAAVTDGFTTMDAPPVATPEMTLIAAPFDFCQALIAGFGPT